MHEQNRQIRSPAYPREALAIGATVLALMGQNIYVGLQNGERAQTDAAKQMLELDGLAALGAAEVVAGRKMRRLMNQMPENRHSHMQEQQKTRNPWAED